MREDRVTETSDPTPIAPDRPRSWIAAVPAAASRLWAIRWDASPAVRAATIARRALWIFLMATVTPVLVLRWAPPPTTAFMIEHRAAARAEGGEGSHLRWQWSDLDDIAPSAQLAVVAAEDQAFPRHHGFDFQAISDAWADNMNGGRLRGGSTISQQVAKNLFLWGGGGFFRKGLEAYFTVLVESLWPKRRILEVYLNVAEFGDGIYGVGAASEVFFEKSPDELTDYEAALLAAVLPSPSRMHPDEPSDYVIMRACAILEFMDKLGPSHMERIATTPEERPESPADSLPRS